MSPLTKFKSLNKSDSQRILLLVILLFLCSPLKGQHSFYYSLQINGQSNIWGSQNTSLGILSNTNDYRAIRAYDGVSGFYNIHFFGSNYQNGQFNKSAGALNLQGVSGVTLGPWDNPNMSIRQSDGFVGIGRPDPTARLDVNGDIKISNANIPMGFTTEVGGDSPILNMGINFRAADRNFNFRGGAFRMDSRNNYQFFQWLSREVGQNNDKVIMSLSEDGDLRLGDIDGFIPSNKGRLHVKGSVHVENDNGNQVFHISAGKELVFVGKEAWSQYQLHDSLNYENDFSLWVSEGIVSENLALATVNQWSDHVFEPDYDLASLEEVKQYILKNGHLPNIPTEAEVLESGYSVSEMDAKFLEKIEELTLYAIEQKMENDVLKSQMKNIENEIKLLKEKLQILVKQNN